MHPVQKAMVEANGTQCGFCTPGFVMSLFAEMHDKNSSDTHDINDTLAGNLCRCTGYGTILTAAKKVAEQDIQDQFHHRQQQTVQLLKILQADESLGMNGSDGQFYAPKTTSELADLLDTYPEAVILAGATDVGLWVTKQHRALPIIIYIGQVKSLKDLTVDADKITIGAGVTYSEAKEILGNHFSDLDELVRRIASTQIRNSGTIGGNIANGSPIGDMPPALIVLNATLTLHSKEGRRDIPLEDFFIQYGQQDLKAGEFVEAVSIPLPKDSEVFRSYKISKRFDQDISALCGAFNLILDGAIVKDIRICYGGMAGTPARAFHAEKSLIGKDWTAASIEQAMTAMLEDYTPLSDMRASREYRMTAAQNLLKKFFIETTSSDTQTRLVGKGSLAHA